MKNIFISVDGGGTKSIVRVEDESGCVIGEEIGGPANIRISVADSWQNIYATLEKILSIAKISLQDKQYHFHAGMALAGCEVAAAHQNFLATPHPFATLHVMSDAHAACLGAHGGKDGAIIIVGTGVIGYQIVNGQISRVGGHGFPHDDEGGGAWLGLEATRLTFQWLDHRAEYCPLVADIFAMFDKDLNRLTTWANQANSTEFASLAPIVIRHSQMQEPRAVELLKIAASKIEKIAQVLTSLPCCLLGSLSVFIEPYLSNDLRKSLVKHEADAVVGAMRVIRMACKCRVDSDGSSRISQ